MTAPITTIRARRGFALIIVMWVVLIAASILLGVQLTTRACSATSRSDLSAVQAHWAARAGVEQALAVLEDDINDCDSKMDDWYNNPDLFQDVELSTGKFSCTAGADRGQSRPGLTDLSERLNVNTADEKQLAALPNMKPHIVDAIIDWRDKDHDTRPAGAEAGYYQRLKYPYEIRNGTFRSIRELLLVSGVNEEVFFGEDSNLDDTLDANENDQNASWPPDNGDGYLDKGLAGWATVYSASLNRQANGSKRTNLKKADKEALKKSLKFSDALAQAVVNQRPKTLADLVSIKPQGSPQGGQAGKEEDASLVKEVTTQWLAEHLDEVTLTEDERQAGLINVNTASREVLLTLPEMTATLADSLTQRQKSAQGVFKSVGQLFTSGLLSEPQFKAMAQRVTVRSSVYEIRSSGTAGGIRQTIIAVVDRDASPMTILYWYQSE